MKICFILREIGCETKHYLIRSVSRLYRKLDYARLNFLNADTFHLLHVHLDKRDAGEIAVNV